MTHIAFVAAGLGLSLLGVPGSLPSASAAPADAVTTHNYQASAAALANPDRGFFHYTQTHYRADGSGYVPLDAAQLTGWRTQQDVTMVYRIFYLEKYADQDVLDEAFLRLVAADLTTARTAGVKLVVRFAYSDSSPKDAPAARVVGHIRQLAPVVNAGADVISVLQAGFVGQWGEWYYSDNFSGSPSQPWVLSDRDWAARSAVLDALLAVTDSHLAVQVRYPGIKQRLFADGDPRAVRVGIHDDCLGAGTDDYGTFPTPADRTWVAEQTRAVPMGGESCALNAPRTEWPSASADLAKYHWSFLNADYHPDVLGSWGARGRAEAQRRLGYRLRLTTSSLPVKAHAGEQMTVRLGVTNDGYAAPFRNRPVQLVLRSGGRTVLVPVPLDLRTLQPGVTVPVQVQVTAPSTAGSYALYLALPDPSPTIAARPAYAVQLANTGTWDAVDGWNDLQHNVEVDTAVPSPAASPVPLGRLTPSGVRNGWGPPEVDHSNGEAAAGDGHPMLLRGRSFSRGLGVHSPSAQTFALGGRYGTLRATVGVDDEVDGRGSVAFRAYVDGRLVYQSPVLTGRSAPLPVTVDVRGGQSLRLAVTDAGDGSANDHADWGSAWLG